VDLAEAAQLAQRASEKAQERRATLTRREAERDAHLSGHDLNEVALPVDVVRRLFAYAQSADHAGLLDKCDDHLVTDGDGCEVCTDLETVQLALWRADSPED
jgi:hypothetical protein